MTHLDEDFQDFNGAETDSDLQEIRGRVRMLIDNTLSKLEPRRIQSAEQYLWIIKQVTRELQLEYQEVGNSRHAPVVMRQ